MNRVLVFAGPTLPANAIRDVLDARVLPPARQGDLYRAVIDHRPTAIGLIDGFFHQAPAVWHHEILWAMAEGVRVFGAASMGALRAAELDGFGMIGVGAVYEAYARGEWPGDGAPFEDDDEVAVTHAPAELGYAPLSVAMVDLRDWLLAAEQAGLLARAERDRLTAALKALPFRHRDLARLAAFARTELASGRAEAFAAFLQSGRLGRTHRDARAMAGNAAVTAPAAAPGWSLTRTLVWEAFTRDAAAARDLPDAETAARLLDELRRDPAAWRAALNAALPWDEPDGGAADLHAELGHLRRERELWRRADLDAWMRAHALSPASLETLLRRQAAVDRAVLTPESAGRMLHHLRFTVDISTLLERAQRSSAPGGDGPA